MHVRNTIKLGALAVAVLGCAQPAFADQAETKGGIKVKTDDGRFEANVGGRIHFDVNVFKEDEDSFGALASGSKLTPVNSSAYLRRVYLTLKGKLYGWNYKIEPDLANNTQTGATTIAFQDITLSTDVAGGELIFGQFKPYRSMEDLTSSNDILIIERPSTSSNGVFSGREFQQGVAYKYPIMEGMLAEASLFSMRGSTTAANEGVGYNARFAWAPMMDDGAVVHVGLNYSYENPQDASAAAPGTATNITESMSYAGRRGPSLNLGATSGSEPAKSLGLEFATVFGPFFLQAEYVDSKLSLQQPTAAPNPDVKAMYAQVAFELTGEHKPYKPADGVFGNVKPLGAAGAFELVARIDTAKNDDLPAGGCTVATTPVSAALTGSDACKATSLTAGLNWYPNPNVRFMFNWIKGKADAGAAGKDEPTAYVARAQVSF